MNILEFLRPNKFKVILFLLLLLPSTVLIILLLGQNYIYTNYNYFTSSFIMVDPLLFLISILLFIVFGLIFSYLFGCFLDHYINNKSLKIIIAIVSGLISLLIIYIFFKIITEPVICDPVHVPNQTVCDPVHQPNQEISSASEIMEIKVDHSAVKESFQECIKNL